MLAEMNSPTFWVDLVQIMGINILLSGDNAVVIALASRSLPEKQRNMAVLGGSAAAIILRVFFCVIIVWLLEIPFLKLIGGLLLLYIGIKLLVPEEEAGEDSVAAKSNLWGAIQTITIADAVMSLDNVVAIAAVAKDSMLLIIPEEEHGEDGVAAKSNLWGAIQTIMIADAVMSLDNVVAIAAVAKDSILLIVLGLIISVPLIVFGSQIVLRFLTRFPILVIAGGGLLGWIAGEIIISDPVIHTRIPYDIHLQEQIARPLLAAFVVIVGMVLARRAKGAHPELVDLAPEDRK